MKSLKSIIGVANGLLLILYALLLRVLLRWGDGDPWLGIKVFLFLWLILGAIGALLQKEWGRRLSLAGCLVGILSTFYHMYFVIRVWEDVAVALMIMWGGLMKFYSLPQLRAMYRRGFKTPNWRILLIDDDRGFQKSMRWQFLSEGVLPLMAVRGEKGMRMAKRYKPDLIILDESLPDIKGLEVCVRLKEDSKTKEIPVVFMTEKEPPEDIRAEIEAGAIAHFNKPLVFSALFCELRKILGE
jgi:CheY-like chemotaxis protein